MNEWADVCRQATDDYCAQLVHRTRTFPRWEKRVAVQLELTWRVGQLRYALKRARYTATPNALLGLCSILCIACAATHRGPNDGPHPIEAWLRTLLRNLDDDPIATTDAPGVLAAVMLCAEEMLAALSSKQLLRRVGEGARPQVIGPDWLMARQ